MLKNGIGVIYKLVDLLEDGGAEKLFDLDIECVQLQCFFPELYTKENAETVEDNLTGEYYG